MQEGIFTASLNFAACFGLKIARTVLRERIMAIVPDTARMATNRPVTGSRKKLPGDIEACRSMINWAFHDCWIGVHELPWNSLLENQLLASIGKSY